MEESELSPDIIRRDVEQLLKQLESQQNETRYLRKTFEAKRVSSRDNSPRRVAVRREVFEESLESRVHISGLARTNIPRDTPEEILRDVQLYSKELSTSTRFEMDTNSSVGSPEAHQHSNRKQSDSPDASPLAVSALDVDDIYSPVQEMEDIQTTAHALEDVIRHREGYETEIKVLKGELELLRREKQKGASAKESWEKRKLELEIEKERQERYNAENTKDLLLLETQRLHQEIKRLHKQAPPPHSESPGPRSENTTPMPSAVVPLPTYTSPRAIAASTTTTTSTTASTSISTSTTGLPLGGAGGGRVEMSDYVSIVRERNRLQDRITSLEAVAANPVINDSDNKTLFNGLHILLNVLENIHRQLPTASPFVKPLEDEMNPSKLVASAIHESKEVLRAVENQSLRIAREGKKKAAIEEASYTKDLPIRALVEEEKALRFVTVEFELNRRLTMAHSFYKWIAAKLHNNCRSEKLLSKCMCEEMKFRIWLLNNEKEQRQCILQLLHDGIVRSKSIRSDLSPRWADVSHPIAKQSPLRTPHAGTDYERPSSTKDTEISTGSVSPYVDRKSDRQSTTGDFEPDSRRGLLVVTILKAEGLHFSSLLGNPDPVVQLAIGNRRYQTTTKSQSRNPIWNETFRIYVKLDKNLDGEDITNEKLFITVKDKDSNEADTLGQAEVPLKYLHYNTRHSATVKLHGDGCMTLTILATDFGIPQISPRESVNSFFAHSSTAATVGSQSVKSFESKFERTETSKSAKRSTPYPFLGIEVSDSILLKDHAVSEETLFTYNGVKIVSIRNYSPAAVAGFRIGDIITSINSVTVTKLADFRAQVESLSPGEDALIGFTRAGVLMEAHLIVKGKGHDWIPGHRHTSKVVFTQAHLGIQSAARSLSPRETRRIPPTVPLMTTPILLDPRRSPNRNRSMSPGARQRPPPYTRQ